MNVINPQHDFRVPLHGPGWFVVQLRPNALAIAVRNLERQRFGVFAPFEEVTARRGGRFATVRAPLFPGYLFVGFDPETAAWRTINSTLGVRRLVSFGTNTPAPVPERLMQGLMRRCDAEGRLLPADRLAEGDEVRITAGPFAEYVATVERIAPGERAWILLDIMGKQTRVAVAPAQLRPLSAGPAR